MKWLTMTLPISFLLVVLFFTIEVLVESVPNEQALGIAFGVSAAAIVVFSRSVFAVIERLQGRLRTQNRDLEHRTKQLEAVNEAGLHVASNLSLSAVLQSVADWSRQLIRARYAAVVVVQDGRIVELITSGFSDAQREAIGTLPEGGGLLGHVLRSGRPYRTNDVASDPHAECFPEHHPPMQTFLGVPIVSSGSVIGNLYLADKLEGEFTDDDEADVQTLAVQAAIAIENARLYDQVQDVAVLEERERIGMDLHDGTIQALYGVGLKIDSCIDRLEAEPAGVKYELDGAIEDLNAIIRDIRSYIFDLRPQLLEGRTLSGSLRELLRDLSVNTLIATELVVDDANKERDPTSNLEEELAKGIFDFAHEALTNVRKHAAAKNVRAEIGLKHGRFSLRVIDDGVGFEAGDEAKAGTKMKEIARALDGKFTIGRGKGGGTVVTLTVPMRPANEAVHG